MCVCVRVCIMCVFLQVFGNIKMLAACEVYLPAQLGRAGQINNKLASLQLPLRYIYYSHAYIRYMCILKVYQICACIVSCSKDRSIVYSYSTYNDVFDECYRNFNLNK